MNDELKIKNNNSDLLHSLILKTHDMIFYISRAIFSIGILCAFLSIGYEVLVWIKTGEWANLRFYMLFSWLNIDPVSLVHGIGWMGIRKILLWCLELPLSVGFVLVGAVFGGLLSFPTAGGRMYFEVEYPEPQTYNQPLKGSPIKGTLVSFRPIGPPLLEQEERFRIQKKNNKMR
jgi:hypothetical protein